MPLADLRSQLQDIALTNRRERNDGLKFADRHLDVDGRTIPIRLYQPPTSSAAGDSSPILFIHGGGWAICSIDTHHDLAADLALDTGRTVLSVEYRLAPEHPYPAALDDCYAAARWLTEYASGASPAQLIVVGDSSGGNLAAALALMARDRIGVSIALQVLLYPVLDYGFDTPSWIANGDGEYGLSQRQMRWYWAQYAPTEIGRESALVAPLRSADLAGVAPAYLVVGEMDPLLDEARAYATALAQAGVPVTLRIYPGGFHGFFSFRGMLDIAAEAAADVAEAILHSDTDEHVNDVRRGT
jgi:acetyl esterase